MNCPNCNKALPPYKATELSKCPQCDMVWYGEYIEYWPEYLKERSFNGKRKAAKAKASQVNV